MVVQPNLHPFSRTCASVPLVASKRPILSSYSSDSPLTPNQKRHLIFTLCQNFPVPYAALVTSANYSLSFVDAFDISSRNQSSSCLLLIYLDKATHNDQLVAYTTVFRSDVTTQFSRSQESLRLQNKTSYSKQHQAFFPIAVLCSALLSPQNRGWGLGVQRNSTQSQFQH